MAAARRGVTSPAAAMAEAGDAGGPERALGHWRPSHGRSNPLGVVSVGQAGLEHAVRCEQACIVPGSLLDCRIADRELAQPVVLDGSAGLPATSPWSVLFAGSGCLGSSSVRAWAVDQGPPLLLRRWRRNLARQRLGRCRTRLCLLGLVQGNQVIMRGTPRDPFVGYLSFLLHRSGHC